MQFSCPHRFSASWLRASVILLGLALKLFLGSFACSPEAASQQNLSICCVVAAVFTSSFYFLFLFKHEDEICLQKKKSLKKIKFCGYLYTWSHDRLVFIDIVGNHVDNNDSDPQAACQVIFLLMCFNLY